MNILIINGKRRWVGIISWTLEISSGLRKRGHKVFVISNINNPFTKYCLKNSIPIIPVRFGMDFNPILIWKIITFIKKNNINIIITNIQKEIYCGGIAGRLCNIPIVRRIGSPVDIGNNWKVKLAQKYFIDKSITPCENVKEKIIQKCCWIQDSNIEVIYNGRDVKYFPEEDIAKQKGKWGIEEGSKIIGVTARLSAAKGISYLIKAYKKISEKFYNTYLVIAGEGKEKKNLLNLIDELRLSERVKLVGFTNNPQFTASCYDIAVLPSIMEGFPNSLVEYMSVGTPSIATNVGGVKEIIKDGVNGFIIEPKNIGQLYQNMKLLIQDEKLRNKIASEAKRTIQTKFSKEIMIIKLEELLGKSI